jgi:hypothetical protein
MGESNTIRNTNSTQSIRLCNMNPRGLVSFLIWGEGRGGNCWDIWISQGVWDKFSMCSHQVPNVFSSCSQFIANMFSSLEHVPQDVPDSIITLYNLCLKWKSPYIGGPKALTSKIPFWACKLPFGGMSKVV